jgi:DNA polymerase-4
MPTITARRLCPHAVFLPNDFEAYMDYSHKIREVFCSFTPLVEPLSLDEAFLDVSGSTRLFGSSVEMAQQIRTKIGMLGLTCTVGVAANKFLAKLASTAAKPDGLLVVPADAVEQFLHPLPVDALWGVGPQTSEVLTRLGLKTVGDLARLSRRTLQRAVGDSLGSHLHDLARGLDDRPVTPDEPAKSVGSEETFAYDLDATDDVLRQTLRLADRTATRLRSKGLCGRTVTLKVRFSNFKTITRSRTVAAAIDTPAEIYAIAKELFLKLALDRPRIRLLGVSVGGLAPGPPKRQLDLLTEPTRAGWSEVAGAVDSIRDRWGEAAVGPATLLDPRGAASDGPQDYSGAASDGPQGRTRR